MLLSCLTKTLGLSPYTVVTFYSKNKKGITIQRVPRNIVQKVVKYFLQIQQTTDLNESKNQFALYFPTLNLRIIRPLEFQKGRKSNYINAEPQCPDSASLLLFSSTSASQQRVCFTTNISIKLFLIHSLDYALGIKHSWEMLPSKYSVSSQGFMLPSHQTQLKP